MRCWIPTRTHCRIIIVLCRKIRTKKAEPYSMRSCIEMGPAFLVFDLNTWI